MFSTLDIVDCSVFTKNLQVMIMTLLYDNYVYCQDISLAVFEKLGA